MLLPPVLLVPCLALVPGSGAMHRAMTAQLLPGSLPPALPHVASQPSQPAMHLHVQAQFELHAAKITAAQLDTAHAPGVDGQGVHVGDAVALRHERQELLVGLERQLSLHHIIQGQRRLHTLHLQACGQAGREGEGRVAVLRGYQRRLLRAATLGRAHARLLGPSTSARAPPPASRTTPGVWGRHPGPTPPQSRS
jgi:hypothetical protein